MKLEGKISGITLQTQGKAEYKVEALDKATTGFFYFTFPAARNLFELEDEIVITVQKKGSKYE